MDIREERAMMLKMEMEEEVKSQVRKYDLIATIEHDISSLEELLEEINGMIPEDDFNEAEAALFEFKRIINQNNY